MNWMPIESAPRDGTWVLLYDAEADGNPYLHAQWCEKFGAWTSRRTRSGKSILWTWDPPIWHRLPAPPTDALDGLGYENGGPVPDGPK